MSAVWGRGFVQCRHFSDKEGSSDADVRTFFCKKFRFFKIYGVSLRSRGGGDQFIADVLYGRPLEVTSIRENIAKSQESSSIELCVFCSTKLSVLWINLVTFTSIDCQVHAYQLSVSYAQSMAQCSALVDNYRKT